MRLPVTTAILFVTSIFATAEEAAAQTPSLAQILAQGGPVIIPIYALSFLCVCLIFYYIFIMRTEVLAPLSLIQKAGDAVDKGDMELAERICVEDASAGAKVIAAGAELARRKAGYAAVKSAVEDEGSRQASLLWEKVQYLHDIAVIAPMLGLLGTVVGMIHSFIGLQMESVIPKQTQVTQGIALELVNTAAGLVLGIFAMIVYYYFRGHAGRIISEMEHRCAKVFTCLASRGEG